MSKKVTAMMLAMALVSPVMMAKIGMADGGGPSLYFEKNFSIPDVGSVVGRVPVPGRGEVELEYSKRTKKSATDTSSSAKVKAEMEALVPAANTVDLPTLNATITILPLTVGAPAVPCTFNGGAKTSQSPFATVIKKGVTYKKVAIEGSTTVVTSILNPTPAVTDRGLTCTGDLSSLMGGGTVTVSSIFGLGAPITDVITGKLRRDD